MAKGPASGEPPLARIRKFPSIFPFLVPILFISACASPGEPITRRPPVPTPIDDLAAEQSGNTVLLTFALPRETVERKPLTHLPTVEIYRSFSQAAAPAGPPPAPALLVTIPSDVVGHYAAGGRATYSDPLTPEILKDYAGESATYIVRTSVSRKKSSDDSNVASVRIQPAPESINDLHAEVVHSAVDLTWTAPDRTPVGPAPPIKEYGIFRAELPAGTPPAPQPSSNLASPTRPAAPAADAATRATPRLERIAQTGSPAYTDSQVALGRTYEYAVRSVVDYSGQEVESGDSNRVTVIVRSSVPPSAPQGLEVILVPATPEAPAHLDLSWAINPETDIAGYNVYRSVEQGVLGTRLNSGLLPTPTFSDMSRVTAQRYFYSVTAVDRSGNESAPSAAVSAEVPAENQP
jgi:hypothetical protein